MPGQALLENLIIEPNVRLLLALIHPSDGPGVPNLVGRGSCLVLVELGHSFSIGAVGHGPAGLNLTHPVLSVLIQPLRHTLLSH